MTKKFTISEKIFNDFPSLKLGILKVENINNTGNNPEITKNLKRAESNFKIPEPIETFPKIKIWREIYQKFGTNPKKYPSSIESLSKRVLSGHSLPNINKLVDIYNTISLEFIFPVGAEDLDKTQGSICLKKATGEESCQVWGHDKPQNCKPGEIIYSDDFGPICRRFNWREVERCCIYESTKNAILVIENPDPKFEPDFQNALEKLQNYVEKFFGGTCEKFVLDKDCFEVGL